MAQLAAIAKSHGVTPADYARQLVEDDLAIQQEAETMTFAQIMGSVRTSAGHIDESEIVTLVDQARQSHRPATRGKKR